MKKVYSGFTLIEVLTSLFILSLILLDFDALEIFALRENRNAYLFSIAENQLQSMIERVRMVNGSDEDLATQVNLWNQENQEILPEGNGIVSGNYPLYQITLFWGEKTTGQTCKQIKLGKLNCLSEKIQL